MIKVGVLGATSPTGQQALRLLQQRDGLEIVAFSRQPQAKQAEVTWVNLSADKTHIATAARGITHWIVLSHIWVLAEHFDLLESSGAKRVVCISSTSRFTKTQSSSDNEHALVERLSNGEATVQTWAQANDVHWTILRPTLIYGRSTDRNLSEIVRFIRRFRVFPLLGRAHGLRQPVYVDDVAKAAVQALFSEAAHDKAYNISGAEQLPYREMVKRVFRAMGQAPLVISIPLWVFRLALRILHLLPRYRHWNDQMVVRMNQDMVFDHEEAKRDFGYDPQPFILTKTDVQVLSAD